MIDVKHIFILIVLIVASLMDWKTKKIPSIFLSGALLISVIIFSENIEFGIFAVLLGMAYGELQNNAFGRADYKALGLIGLTIPTQIHALLFLGIFGIIQLAYTFIVRKKFENVNEIPFIPALTIIYLFTMVAYIWV